MKSAKDISHLNFVGIILSTLYYCQKDTIYIYNIYVIILKIWIHLNLLNTKLTQKCR